MPSTFFNADLEEDIREWTDLAKDTPVLINPAIEEAYRVGHTGGVNRCFYRPPVMLPVTVDMIRGIAATHFRNGADGLYLFNWFGTAPSYDYDNRTALDDIGNPLRLRYKDKRYVVMRADEGFPNCFSDRGQLPVKVDRQGVTVTIDVADDLKEAGTRIKSACLSMNINNLTVTDKLEVSLNGKILQCTNPKVPGAYDLGPPLQHTSWQNYNLLPDRRGESSHSERIFNTCRRHGAFRSILLSKRSLDRTAGFCPENITT